MHLYFNDDITIESVNNLVEKLEGKEDIDLWFSTYGGDCDSMDFLIDHLNSLGEKIVITLTDCLVSAGTKLLTDYKGRLKTNDLDFILFHKFDREHYTLRTQTPISYKQLRKQDLKGNKIFAKKLKKLGLTKEQLKIFKSGKDLVLYKKDIKKLNL